MLRKRVLTSLAAGPLALAAVWLGNPWFALLVTLVVILACREFYGMTLGTRDRGLGYLGTAMALGLALTPLYPPGRPVLFTAATTLPLAWLVLSTPKQAILSRWGLTLAGTLYIGWLLSHLIGLRDLGSSGREWALLALLVTFSSDTTAFFGGRALGRHHLAPAISPGKTWEGGAAGLLGGIAAGILLTYLLALPLLLGQAILLGALASIAGQMGDMAESMIKRGAGVKDSGGLLPGHGGILDRLDSVVFTSPVVYYLVVWLG